MTPPKRKVQKYDGVTRAKVWARIEDLMKAGLPSPKIAAAMQAEGFRMPDGDTPITQTYITHTMNYLAKTVKVTHGIEPEAKKGGRLPSTCEGILTDPNLNAEQKVKMLIAYADL